MQSYSGKYVPSIAHWILQAKDMTGANSSPQIDQMDGKLYGSIPHGSGASALMERSEGRLGTWRHLPRDIRPPVFNLAGN